jgi:hypothetical protein
MIRRGLTFGEHGPDPIDQPLGIDENVEAHT